MEFVGVNLEWYDVFVFMLVFLHDTFTDDIIMRIEGWKNQVDLLYAY
jgi:hypothetical protein